MLKAEYQGNEGFLQRDSVEHKGYAEARSTDRREENAETSYKAKPWTQCPQSDAGSKGIYPRLDWLFSSSRYEADAAVLGWMDAAQIPNVHLEAVEEAQNKGGQFEKAGHPG